MEREETRLKQEDFESIAESAKRRFSVYMDMDMRATHRDRELRKEDFLTYWIAVEAYERGHGQGITYGL